MILFASVMVPLDMIRKMLAFKLLELRSNPSSVSSKEE